MHRDCGNQCSVGRSAPPTFGKPRAVGFGCGRFFDLSWSGDYVLAFSTDPALRTAYQSETPLEERTILRDDQLSPLFQAVKDATEEAVINSLLQATTTTGFRGHRVEAIEPEQVVEVLKKYGRSVTFPPD